MIPGIVVDVGPEAVVVSSSTPLNVVSSAVSGGGLTAARAIINLHVSKDDRCDDPDGMLSRFASRAGIASPYVGLLTSAWTERAAVAEAQAFGIRALAVITVGLGDHANRRSRNLRRGTADLLLKLGATPLEKSVVQIAIKKGK